MLMNGGTFLSTVMNSVYFVCSILSVVLQVSVSKCKY